MADGIGCICGARSWGECCCGDIDWTPRELVDARDTIERQAAEIAELKEWREDARRYIERQATLLKMAKERLEAHCGGKCNAEYNPCWDRNVINEIEEYEHEAA